MEMKFIELSDVTNSRTRDVVSKIMVNIENIESIQIRHKYYLDDNADIPTSYIYLTSGDCFYVTETIDGILNLIKLS